MGKCNSCRNSTTSCTCKKKPEPCCNSCDTKVSTNCVIYDANPNRSNLTCFLGVNNGTTLTKILEILDKKLCIPISKCAKEKLGLGYETDISMAVIRMLDYVCEQEDVKVKASEEDTTNGYLYDKIATGDCIKKSLVTDYLGAQKVKLELDFPCIEDKLSCCGGNNTSITIQGPNTVCGNELATLTAISNCSTSIVWSNGLTGPTIQASAGIYYATCGGRQSNIITITSTGNCGCIPIWRDAVPLAIFCGATLGYNPCKKYIKQTNQCNNDIQWVEYTGSNSDGSDCPGCGPATFIATRTQTFLRNNCGAGCTPGSVTFSKTYSSSVSQAVADTLAANDNNFVIEGQNYANSTGACSNCPNTPYTATRTESFIRNNCTVGCTGSSVSFTKTYTSYISQADANTMASTDTTFTAQGQAYANTNGTCTGVNCNGCIPTSNLTCSSNGTSISYSNSCSTSLGSISLNELQSSCSGSGLATISASYTPSGGLVTSDYIIEFAITAINGVNQAGVYQANNQFTGLAHNTSYTISMRTLRGGGTCTVSRTILIGDCGTCTDPIGTISISADTTTVCGGGSAVLTAISTNCNIIEWYRVNPLTPDLLVGTGNSITVTPTSNSAYEARCINCNLGFTPSNTINISYLDTCPGACPLDITSAGNIQNTQRTVYFTGATPFSDYSYSSDGGNTWNPITSSSVIVTTAGSYTYCVRKNSDHTCIDCVTFTVSSTGCTSDWVNVGNTYCNGANLVQMQHDNNGCELDREIVIESNSASCCTPVWNNTEDIRCGNDPDVNQDVCSKWRKQIQTCTNAVKWVFYASDTTCSGCVTSFTNSVIGYHSATVDYYKTCPSGCTSLAVPYYAESTVAIGTVSGATQQAANDNAQAQAVANVNADQAANGQNNANNTSNSIACDCPCVEVWSGTGEIVCFSDIPSGESVIDPASCWKYEKQTNQCNSNVRWVKSSEDICNCTPCLFTPIITDIPGTEYCDGANCMIQQQNQCGQIVQPRLIEVNCADCACTPNWQAVVPVQNSCFADITDGYPINNTSSTPDACCYFTKEADGCGNYRWTYVFDGLGCSGCVTAPCPDQFNSGIVSPPVTCGLNQTVTITSYVNNMTPDTTVILACSTNFVNSGSGFPVTTVGTNATKTFGFATIPWPFAGQSNYVGEVLNYSVTILRPGCPDYVEIHALTCIANQNPCDPDGTFLRYESDGCTTCRDAGGSDYDIPGLIEILANGNCGERAGNSIPGNCGGDTYIGPC